MQWLRFTLSPGDPGGPSCPEAPYEDMRRRRKLMDSSVKPQITKLICYCKLRWDSANLFSWFPSWASRTPGTSGTLPEEKQVWDQTPDAALNRCGKKICNLCEVRRCHILQVCSDFIYIKMFHILPEHCVQPWYMSLNITNN